MINSAKFSASRKSNYGLRRRASKALELSNTDYSLYGNNWDMPLRKEIVKRAVALKNSLIAKEIFSFRELLSEFFYTYPEFDGPLNKKEEVLGDSEMSLVIENESDWITEKIFDSICAGSVPIFVGPILSHDFPELDKCIISVEPDAKLIAKRILEVTESELAEKKNAIARFLQIRGDDGIDFWNPRRLWDRAGEIVQKSLVDNVHG